MIGKKRNFGLDVLRAISIILVLLEHKFSFQVELGILGVQVFFILSGFLIGQILIKDFKNGSNVHIVLNFWKRRWFRTLPLYYLVLTIMLFILPNPFGWKIIVYYFFLQANFVGIDFLAVSWSLVVEEWFYIFLPIATLILLPKGISPKRFSFFLLFFIIFFFLCRFAWNYFNKGAIVYQFDCLLLGVMLANLKAHYQQLYTKMNNGFLAGLGLMITIFLVCVLGKKSDHAVFETFYYVTWYFLISFSICLVVPFMEQSGFVNEVLSRRKTIFEFFTWTSILSYSIYLIHPLIYDWTILNNYYLNYTFQVAIIYLLSFILYVMFERPFMNLRDGFSFARYRENIRFFNAG